MDVKIIDPTISSSLPSSRGINSSRGGKGKWVLGGIAAIVLFQVLLGMLWQLDMDAGAKAFRKRDFELSSTKYEDALAKTNWLINSSDKQSQTVSSLFVALSGLDSLRDSMDFYEQHKGRYANAMAKQANTLVDVAWERFRNHEVGPTKDLLYYVQHVADKAGQISATSALAQIHACEGHFDDAEYEFNEALKLAKTGRNEAVIGTLFARLGLLALAQKKFQDAEMHSYRALIFLKKSYYPTSNAWMCKATDTLIAAASAQKKPVDQFIERYRKMH